MSSSDTSFQVLVLAGGECKRLYPLTSGGTVKALLPVGNRPLISYPLRSLTEAGIKSCIVVALGEHVSAAMQSYLADQEAAGGVSCRVLTVPEDCGSADALRQVAKYITAETTVVYSGDLLTDLPLKALVVTHQVTGALATLLVGHLKTSPTTETKPGKPPRGVDYLGLDPARQTLLFAASSPESLRDLKLPLAAVQQAGCIELHSDLQDQHLYVFSRTALKLLTSQPSLSSIKLDFIPWLTRHQLKQRSCQHNNTSTHSSTSSLLAPMAAAAAIGASSRSYSQSSPPTQSGTSSAAAVAEASRNNLSAAAADGYSNGSSRSDVTDGEQDGANVAGASMPGEGYMHLSHSAQASSSRSERVGLYLVPQGRYAARVNTVQAYGDVNREVAAADTALHLTGQSVSKYDNVVPASVSLGAKATIGPACIVGEDCIIGDKSSVKRTVMGNNCKLGTNVKVINCVFMDNVVAEDGCHIQNCVVCSGVVVQERCSLKDCQVGPGFVVAQASEHKSETLART
eukprot:GHRR01011381.1.p1 GENE.GHRR01011381.1~~GHRR01011381.1.p1  ORF type:complete len:515 (+),score=167.39 GHRR01011381.1:92-1636(+)